VRRPVQPFKAPRISFPPQASFGAVFSRSIAEAVTHSGQGNDLSLETWNGHTAKISKSTGYGDLQLVPGKIGTWAAVIAIDRY
jgi:hypothetical protein